VVGEACGRTPKVVVFRVALLSYSGAGSPPELQKRKLQREVYSRGAPKYTGLQGSKLA
jgi:hypothetical protein